MTVGILLATTPAAEGPTALMRAGEKTLLERVAGQIRASGVTEIVVLTRVEWVTACKQVVDADVRATDGAGEELRAIAEIAARAPAGVVVSQADVLVHDGAVRGLLAEPRTANGVLSGPAFGDGWALRVRRGRIVGAESPFHRVGGATTAYLGMLRVGPDRRSELAAAAADAAVALAAATTAAWAEERAAKRARWEHELIAEEAFARLGTTPRRDLEPDTSVVPAEVAAACGRRAAARAVVADDSDAILLVALVRAGVTLRCSYVRELSWARERSQHDVDAAFASMAAVDEEKVLMTSAVKVKDGFTTTFLFSPYTKYAARWAAKRGLHPNQVTVASLVLGGCAATAFAIGSRPALVVGAVLLWAAFATDCVDGQLARYAKDFSALGAWLDPMADRAKEYLVFAGLAAGAVRHGADPVATWGLACAALAFQTVRHVLDFSFAAGQHQVIESLPRRPLADPDDGWVPEIAPDQTDDGVGAWDAHGEEAERRRGASALAAGVVLASRRAERIGVLRWLKRIVVLPIGERYTVIAIGGAASGAHTVFWVLLVWGALALVYGGTGRLVRSAARA